MTSATPPGECPQCWQHAYDRRIHRSLGPREPCRPCEDHANNGCPDRRKKSSRR